MPTVPAFATTAAATAATLLVLGAAGCSGKTATDAAPGGPPPESVTVAAPLVREFTPSETLTGRIDAVDSVEVRPRVSGYLTEVRFQAGQRVRKGDVLFVIDPRPFQAALQRAEAEVETARTRLSQSERDAARAEQMLKTKAISLEEADLRRTRLAEAKAGLALAEAGLVAARLNVEYSEIRSPIDGQVSRAFVTPGNNVSGMDGANTLLTTVVSVDPVHVYADLDESVLLRLEKVRKEGKLPVDAQGRIRVRIGLADEEGFPHDAVVESLDNRLDPATGSLVVRAVLPNPDGRFIPGLFARLSIPVGPAGPALFVPDSVLGTEQNRKFVYTVSASNTVEKHFVVPGPVSGGLRLVSSGLTAADRVVVNGLIRIQFPGQPVVPMADTNPPAR